MVQATHTCMHVHVYQYILKATHNLPGGAFVLSTVLATVSRRFRFVAVV